jgi:NADH-quinone oxidoreductase subunit G
MANIEIEIDGRKLSAQSDQTVIQVADEAGIYIPRFCYHKHLSIAANCRMCLVEIEKSPKTLPACATLVMPGMKVFTRSEKTLLAQRAIMEFLLINHPLDCPICDQGGECELQDIAMGYGRAHSHYSECKRAVKDENLGPLIATEMTRCIQCTRCVRFCDEIAGVRELGAMHRGEHMEIGTYVEQAMQSEVSGNIIDLCPVGALTARPYRFTARAWELDQAPSISPHDCMGTNINVHTRYGTVMRVVARENVAINETWLADRDRFGYTGLYHADRLAEPIARIDGHWQSVAWQQALEIAATGIRRVIKEQGADAIGALASTQSTIEEFYLLQKLMRNLGSPHIDHRLREIDTSDQQTMPIFPGLSMALTELAQCDAILLVGSNIRKEQPLLALQLRKASRQGVTVMAVNPVDYDFNFLLSTKKIVTPQEMPRVLAAMINVLQLEFTEVTADTAMQAMVQQLCSKQKSCIVLGSMVMHHPQAATLRYLAARLAELSGATLCFLTDGANSAGGWLAGAIPHRHAGGSAATRVGLSAYNMLVQPRQAYLLLNVEPEFDCAHALQAVTAIQQAQCVVALSLYRNPVLEMHADVMLPMAAFTETAGTYVNVTGEWQSFHGVASPYQSSRPAWKILRVLANFLDIPGFDYESADQIRCEVRELVGAKKLPMAMSWQRPDHVTLSTKEGISRVGDIPIHSIDSILRHANPLQEAQSIMEGNLAVARLHPDTAQHLSLKTGDIVRVRQQGNKVELPLLIDTKIAVGAAWVPGGIAATSGLGDLFGMLEIEKV